ncbi:MAG: thiamine diphosphokinase [Flavobacteriales bacterium]|nr:MAG: thiamine diphosphokinase [Flavobacteriales bacterium]
MKAILFINGDAPTQIPHWEGFDMVACTDGALHYLLKLNFPVEKLDFISGDFDSHIGEHIEIDEKKFIPTPDQSQTDFHKALAILMEKGVKEVQVYGASGGEQDHFLGNLTTVYQFKKDLDIRLFDEYSHYFFLDKKHQLRDVKHKMISLYPFPFAENITTKGLHWDLKGQNLSLTEKISTRNYADANTVDIQFEKGEVLVFIGKKNYNQNEK